MMATKLKTVEDVLNELPASNVHRKLSDARKQFHRLKLKKSGRNTFADYSYFELSDFLIPALELFDHLGLCATVSFTADLATMTIVDIDRPNDAIVITSPMGSAKLKACHEVQNIGAVETYQRRYLWIAALEIVEHDALDSSEPDETQGPVPISGEQFELIQELAPKAGKTLQQISDAYKVSGVNKLTSTQADKVINRLRADAKEPVNA